MKPKFRISIRGTRSGKLRARVVQDEGHYDCFEVTVRGKNFYALDENIQGIILDRAQSYVERLQGTLS